MAQAFKCDICGKLIPGTPANLSHKVSVDDAVQGFVRYWVTTTIDTSGFGQDFCIECRDLILRTAYEGGGHLPLGANL